mmetsp:Transcript_45823/g.147130  ORF Transcript_45823/g.147130 Transcript_45823/m.147130 type:complete len:231 (-) Transcript_45823:474-1166(-)
MLFYMLSQMLPFQGDSFKSTCENTLKPSKLEEHKQLRALSVPCQGFLFELLEQDPKRRPSAATAVEALWLPQPEEVPAMTWSVVAGQAACQTYADEPFKAQVCEATLISWDDGFDIVETSSSDSVPHLQTLAVETLIVPLSWEDVIVDDVVVSDSQWQPPKKLVFGGEHPQSTTSLFDRGSSWSTDAGTWLLSPSSSASSPMAATTADSLPWASSASVKTLAHHSGAGLQ